MSSIWSGSCLTSSIRWIQDISVIKSLPYWSREKQTSKWESRNIFHSVVSFISKQCAGAGIDGMKNSLAPNLYLLQKVGKGCERSLQFCGIPGTAWSWCRTAGNVWASFSISWEKNRTSSYHVTSKAAYSFRLPHFYHSRMVYHWQLGHWNYSVTYSHVPTFIAPGIECARLAPFWQSICAVR